MSVKSNQEGGAAILFMIALVNFEVSAYEVAITNWSGAFAFGLIGVALMLALLWWARQS